MEFSKSKKNFVIIDGYGFVFRAFFSLKDLKTPEGLPIGAVYGFINMVLKLYSSLKIDYIILVFDSGKKSFRSDIYPEYKANRSAAPDDLIPQFSIIREATSALNIKFIEIDGFEADDLIGAYAKKASEEDFFVTVVTSDKDLMQLVKDESVQVYDPIKNKSIKEADVFERYGVKPLQIVDYLAICGDASDNIPGVAGIGEKGAVELLSKFETLEEIYENLESIEKPKLKNSLIKSRENAILSKRLSSLDFNAPTESVEKFLKTDFNKNDLYDFLKKYSLNSIIAKTLPDFLASQQDLFEFPISTPTELGETPSFKKLSPEDLFSTLKDSPEIVCDLQEDKIILTAGGISYIIECEA
jgi:DNA polymerase-1